GVNHRPRVAGGDLGIWRRLLLIPFSACIPVEAVDEDLPAKLSLELPGILRWAVMGAAAYRASGFAIPPEVRDATADYKADMDWFADFLADRCLVGEEHSATRKA